MSIGDEEPKRSRNVETALLLALALATAFNWQNLKSVDRWLFGAVDPAPPGPQPPARPGAAAPVTPAR